MTAGWRLAGGWLTGWRLAGGWLAGWRLAGGLLAGGWLAADWLAGGWLALIIFGNIPNFVILFKTSLSTTSHILQHSEKYGIKSKKHNVSECLSKHMGR